MAAGGNSRSGGCGDFGHYFLEARVRRVIECDRPRLRKALRNCENLCQAGAAVFEGGSVDSLASELRVEQLVIAPFFAGKGALGCIDNGLCPLAGKEKGAMINPSIQHLTGFSFRPLARNITGL